MLLDVKTVRECAVCSHNTPVAGFSLCGKTGKKIVIEGDRKFPENCPLTAGLFFVTGVTTDQRGDDFRSRTFGYYPDQKSAIEDVLDNYLDINEAGHYPLIVIDEVGPSIHGFAEKGIWFKFNKDSEKYEPCECPGAFEKTINWGCG